MKKCFYKCKRQTGASKATSLDDIRLLVFSFHHSPLSIGAMCIVEKWRPNKYLSCLPSRCSTLQSLHVAQTIFCFPLQNWIKKDLLSRLLFRPFFRISRIPNLSAQYTVMQCRYCSKCCCRRY